MVRVAVKGELLRWARERAGLGHDALAKRFPHLAEWEREEVKPTLKQLEDYAKATYAPVGYFFLPEPPHEPVPIPDFRTIAGRGVTNLSPNLRETIYACQERQDWFRDYARATGAEHLRFVASATLQSAVVETAEAMRRMLNFDVDARRTCATWEEALRTFIGQADRAGILVMCSGIVMNNTHRKLDPEEFRGFALADDLAPLVFINGADTKSAQMFTLAHELAHIWLGQTALSDTTVASSSQNTIERWCNSVAAEMLVPLATLREDLQHRQHEDLPHLVSRLGRRFKVSSLVILQRLRDSKHLSWDEFNSAYDSERQRLANLVRKDSGGGDFYLTAGVRFSKRFSRALVESTFEGHTLYRDALRMLGISKSETLRELGRTLMFGG